MTTSRRRGRIWVMAVGLVFLITTFFAVFGPPGTVDLVRYREVEPGVIDVVIPCRAEIARVRVWVFDKSIWIFATGSDPEQYALGGSTCNGMGHIDLGTPIDGRRLIDGFDLSTIPGRS